MRQVFYTCTPLRSGKWTATYIDATVPKEEWEVQKYGMFDDPSEASGEFKAMIGPEKECMYLEEAHFKLKRAAMIAMRNKALLKESYVG